MAWFAYDIDAYDSDTMHLTPAEDGVYMRLIRHYYKTRLPLPDDDKALSNIARISPTEFDAMRATIRAFFKTRRGRLIHRRIDAELDSEDKRAVRRSEKARNAALKRHAISKTRMPRAKREHAPSMLDVCQTVLPDQTRHAEEANASSAPVGAPAASIPFDTKAAIFGEQLAWLRDNTGKTEGSLRSWLGKCCGEYGEVEALAAILNIRSNPTPVDPISRMRSILERHGKRNGTGQAKLSAVEGIYAGFAIELGERERQADRRADSDAPQPLLDSRDVTGTSDAAKPRLAG